jgi:hypothetical protein
MSNGVQYLCVAPDHVKAGRDSGGGVLTITHGEWGFCPFGRTEGHVWDRVEGQTITQLREVAQRRRKTETEQT